MNERPHPLLLVREQMRLVARGQVAEARLSFPARQSLRRA